MSANLATSDYQLPLANPGGLLSVTRKLIAPRAVPKGVHVKRIDVGDVVYCSVRDKTERDSCEFNGQIVTELFTDEVGRQRAKFDQSEDGSGHVTFFLRHKDEPNRAIGIAEFDRAYTHWPNLTNERLT